MPNLQITAGVPLICNITFDEILVGWVFRFFHGEIIGIKLNGAMKLLLRISKLNWQNTQFAGKTELK